MLEGGPIYDYLRYGGNNSLNGLYIVGYQVEGTLGADIVSGKRELTLDNGFGQLFEVSLALEVKRFEFSGHATLDGLIQMVRYSSPSLVYLTTPLAQVLREYFCQRSLPLHKISLGKCQLIPEY